VALGLAKAASKDDPARLVLADRDAAPLQALADELRAGGAEVIAMAADLLDVEAAAAVVAKADTAFGGLDALVSNAGALKGALLKDLSLADYAFQFDINCRPTWLLAKAAYPMLKASRGSVCATGSMSAEHATPPLGSYSASKAALVMLVKQMAIEWGPDGIRANCVSPGPTLTAMTQGGYADPARRAQRESTIPLRRLGRPEDIANAILFMISAEAAFITGVDLVVDGGMSANLMPSTGAGTGQT
jgi:NAD(P)-dependent dehydrogenase (short-subunit alcohol dehydrogenase family)